MVKVTSQTVDHEIATISDHQIVVSQTDTRVEFNFGTGAWGWSYRRPTRGFHADDPVNAVRLHDHVMLTRAMLVAVTIILLIMRRR